MLTKSSPSRVAAAFGCLLLAITSGCTVMETAGLYKAPEVPPPAVDELLTRWDPYVRFASDTVNPGHTIPGLAGRVYLFNEQLRDGVDAQGHITATLFDMTPVAAGGAPVQVAIWDFDPQSLKKMKKKDMIGDGYTLFLPWEEYRPEIRQVKLKLAYVNKQGQPQYSDESVMTLQTGAPPTIDRQTVPAGYQQTAKK
jgi:hypothetical protein